VTGVLANPFNLFGNGEYTYKHLQDLLTSRKANSYQFDSYTFIYNGG